MGNAPGKEEAQRENVGPGAPLAAYRYFGRCYEHGRVEILNPGKHWPPLCPDCGLLVDPTRVTRKIEQ
jgi:hypothetical protein